MAINKEGNPERGDLRAFARDLLGAPFVDPRIEAINSVLVTREIVREYFLQKMLEDEQKDLALVEVETNEQ